MSQQADFLIIGAGIAAASVAYWLAPHGRVIVLERESQPGYHSTGRSAALFMESYGTPQVRALTMASRTFMQTPPAGFSEPPLLHRRGALIMAEPGQEALLAQKWAAMRALIPALRPEKVLGAVFEPDAADIDLMRCIKAICVACAVPAACWSAMPRSMAGLCQRPLAGANGARHLRSARGFERGRCLGRRGGQAGRRAADWIAAKASLGVSVQAARRTGNGALADGHRHE